MKRPRFSTLALMALLSVAILLAGLVVLLDRNDEADGKTVVTVRLWDEQVAAAYRDSFAEFSRTHPDIEVLTVLVSYASYFDTLRTDVAGGGADDIFWINNSHFAEYADNGRLMEITPSSDWEPAVVGQFTRGEKLWGVPQLTDAGIALYYNADLLAAAGVSPETLGAARWDPDPAKDTLRPLLARLTVDASGKNAATAGFDPRKIRQWGYNAANDLQGINLNFIGSAGGTFSEGDRFTFDSPAAAAGLGYVVGLINTDHVAPPASDTNDNGDFSRNHFLSGRMAVFQSGTYNLAQVAGQARFRWGVTMLPTGPAGRVSVTNGIVAAGNSATRHPDAVRAVLAWLGGPGNAYLGRSGAAIPAVLSAQRVFRLLEVQERRRDAVLYRAQWITDRRARRRRIRRRLPGHQAVLRRDVPGPAAGPRDAGRCPACRQHRRAALASARNVPAPGGVSAGRHARSRPRRARQGEVQVGDMTPANKS